VIYRFNGEQFLTALDAAQNVLLTVALDSSSSDSATHDFVGIQSDTANIRYVVIANDNLSVDPNWGVGGLTTFFDDFTFEAIAAPEPSALALLGLGLLGLAAVRRTCR
jgi:hypothetical protein